MENREHRIVKKRTARLCANEDEVFCIEKGVKF